MKALCWQGKNKVSVENVPDPKILNPRDAIIKITTAAICGSDLHLYDGYIPTMQKGDILGHENMGEVVEVGASDVRSRGLVFLPDASPGFIRFESPRRCDADQPALTQCGDLIPRR